MKSYTHEGLKKTADGKVPGHSERWAHCIVGYEPQEDVSENGQRHWQHCPETGRSRWVISSRVKLPHKPLFSFLACAGNLCPLQPFHSQHFIRRVYEQHLYWILSIIIDNNYDSYFSVKTNRKCMYSSALTLEAYQESRREGLKA